MGSKRKTTDNANLPRFRPPFIGSNGKKTQGFWYLWHEGKQVNLSKLGAPRENGTTKAILNAVNEARNAYLAAKGQEEVIRVNTVVTIYDALQNYVKTRLPSLSKDSQRNIKAALENFCTGKDGKGLEVNGVAKYEGFGTLPAASMTKKLLDQWASFHPGWATPGTKRANITPIKSAWAVAVEDGLIAENPIADYKLPQGQPREDEIDQEQEQALRIAAAKLCPAFLTLFAAMIELGSRPGELATLRAHHFNEKTGEWVLESAEWKCGRKTNRQRFIALTPAWIAWTKTRIAEMDGRDGYLFVTGRLANWTRTRWDDWFSRCRKAAGLPDTTVLYSARHSFITRALLAGSSVADIATQCGTSIGEIQAVYSKMHLHPEARKRVVMSVAAGAVAATPVNAG
jgi:integrase